MKKHTQVVVDCTIKAMKNELNRLKGCTATEFLMALECIDDELKDMIAAVLDELGD